MRLCTPNPASERALCFAGLGKVFFKMSHAADYTEPNNLRKHKIYHSVFVHPQGMVQSSQMSNRLRIARKRRKMTQTELAEAAGISQPHIYRLEKGINGISLELALRLAEALGVDPYEIMNDGDLGPDAAFLRSLPKLSAADKALLLQLMQGMIAARQDVQPQAQEPENQPDPASQQSRRS